MIGQGEEMTRLIQLEERWREAEEREAEAQQTKHTPSVSKPVSKTAKDFVGEGKLAAAFEYELAQPHLSTESSNCLVLLQARLSQLEVRKTLGVVDAAGYNAEFNTLVVAFLAFLAGED